MRLWTLRQYLNFFKILYVSIFMLVIFVPEKGYAAQVQVIGATQQSIQIEQNKGKLIMLPEAASTVFIADSEIAEVMVRSPKLVYISALKIGETTLFAVGANNNILANVNIHIRPNISSLQDKIASLYPQLEIEVSAISDSVLLRGYVRTGQQAALIKEMAVKALGAEEMVVNQLSVMAPSQINLRVQVAEVSREIQRQLGINWTANGGVRSGTFSGLLRNPFIDATLPAQLGLGAVIGNVSVSALLDALDNEGLVTLLAEPNLTAVSGETASFLAGGEFPIIVPDSDDRVTILFKKFGISLAFTPILMGENRINLHVRPEVSQLSSENAVTLRDFEIPALTTRRAETTVELGSGQSFAIAGLIQSDSSYDIAKTPGLASIPIFGELFKSDDFQRSESELVIIITPYIVEPVNGNPFVKPTDRLYQPRVADGIEQVNKDEMPNLFQETKKQTKFPRPDHTGFLFD